ncbi:MAG: DNA primase [Flavobacteriaceae bacterium]|nr:DNA primase [Flavobacteriaceae bacterium]
MITKETIDKIFSTIRVEEIIGEYVQLKRAGANYKGLSPFVDEKTPSFIVSPSKQIWKDFSSGKGGTAISFLMEIENFTYPEALRYAAKKYGIEVEETVKQLTEEEKIAQSEKDLLYKIHEVANDFFQQQLWQSEEGKLIGLSYFKERELREDIIQKFQLGYSPEQRNAFTQYALEKGYSKEILEKSGLSVFPENAPNGVDRFRERVIFPIHSFSGRVLGFGARILKSNVKVAKYLNSPETEIYHKSNILYGLNQSKQAISKQNNCLLVEGYMDVVALHQAGIENVVASSGTSLTTEQIKLIKRLTDNVTILFDGDAAGIKASFRSIDMLLSEGMNIRVVLFPDGDDPDSFSRKHPRDFVEQFIKDNAKDFINFKAEILLKEVLNDPIKKAEAIRDIVKSVAFVPNGLKQEVYLKEIASQFGISERNLFTELQTQIQIIKGQPQPKSKMEVVQNRAKEGHQYSEKLENMALLVLEEKLIELMMKYGNYTIKRRDEQGEVYEISVIEEILKHFEEDNIEVFSEINRNIINDIKNGLKEQELRVYQHFLNLADEEIVKKVADKVMDMPETSNWTKYNIYFKNYGENFQAEVNDSILRHKHIYVEKMMRDNGKLLDEARDSDEEKYNEILLLNAKLAQYNAEIKQYLNRIV